MNSERLNRAAPFLRRVAAGRLLRERPFCLVDVGASGGIEDYWRQFEPDLAAFGFEPMVEECARLNAQESSGAVRYFDLRLGCDDYDQVFPAAERGAWSDAPFARSSAMKAQQLLGMSYGQSVKVAAPQTLSGQGTTLERFMAGRPGQHVDFIKVDTDGHDYEVLRGARRVLAERRVLGLLVEAPFQGVTHPHAQLFASIDRLLREQGFSLFDLEPYRYSRACLPGAFALDLPAQTHAGQVMAADALYFRDLCAPGYAARWSFVAEPRELLKLACLHELFGLADCAAEILLAHGQALKELVALDESLDLLVPGRSMPYRELLRQFDADPRSFFAAARRGGSGWASPAQLKAERDLLRNAEAERDAVLGSTSWKITAPLRALSRWLRGGEKS